MEIKTSPRRRKCKYPLCKHILSIYNHETYCHIHLSPAFQEDKTKERSSPFLVDKWKNR